LDTGDQADKRWPRYDAADTGFRNYWYPVLESKKLGKKPRAVTLCGDNIVLGRDRGTVRALHDRCPHRGIPLSAGRREFPGTVTCIYHGWTYDLASGELVEALTDGPDSPICGKASVRVRTYPVAERAGMIWIYPGDAPAPPVEDDIPDELLAPGAVIVPLVEHRKGNWRYAMENAVDEAHARYLHRRTPFALFRKFPAYQTDVRMVPMPDGKWLHRQSKPVFGPVAYKRVGAWPGNEGFWRRAGNQIIIGRARLPAIFSVGHKNWTDFQIFVPVDADHQLTVQVAVRQTSGLGALLFRLRLKTYLHWFHRMILQRREDGFIVAAMDCPPERLYRPDIAIVQWRQWSDAHARPSPAATADGARITATGR
jgi:phenylpropionate dioxygenase-like ring-hydroxylating dioxygenase large terminal subunit